MEATGGSNIEYYHPGSHAGYLKLTLTQCKGRTALSGDSSFSNLFFSEQGVNSLPIKEVGANDVSVVVVSLQGVDQYYYLQTNGENNIYKLQAEPIHSRLLVNQYFSLNSSGEVGGKAQGDFFVLNLPRVLYSGPEEQALLVTYSILIRNSSDPHLPMETLLRC